MSETPEATPVVTKYMVQSDQLCGDCDKPGPHAVVIRSADKPVEVLYACPLHLDSIRSEFNDPDGDTVVVRIVNTLDGEVEHVSEPDHSLAPVAEIMRATFGSDAIAQLLDDHGFRSPSSDAMASKYFGGWAWDNRANTFANLAEVTRVAWELGREPGNEVGGWSVRVIMDPVTNADRSIRAKTNPAVQSPHAKIIIAWHESTSPRLEQVKRNGRPVYDILPSGTRVPRMQVRLRADRTPWMDDVFGSFMLKDIDGANVEDVYDAALALAGEVADAMRDHYDEIYPPVEPDATDEELIVAATPGSARRVSALMDL